MSYVNQISQNEIEDKAARTAIVSLQKQVEAMRLCILALVRMVTLVDYTFAKRAANSTDVQGYLDAKNTYGEAIPEVADTAYQLCYPGDYRSNTTDEPDIYDLIHSQDNNKEKYYIGTEEGDFNLYERVKNYYKGFSKPTDSYISHSSTDSNIF